MIRTTIAGAASALFVAGAAADHGNDGYAPAGYDSFGRPIDYVGADHRFHYHGGRRLNAHCYDVTAVKLDPYGREALYGGVQCVDAYGCSWILEGSRYFIRYVDGYASRRHRYDRRYSHRY